MNLKAERLNRGESLRVAAKRIRCAPDTLTLAERGGRPRPATAKRIADYYGVRVTDIWPLDEDEAA